MCVYVCLFALLMLCVHRSITTFLYPFQNPLPSCVGDLAPCVGPVVWAKSWVSIFPHLIFTCSIKLSTLTVQGHSVACKDSATNLFSTVLKSKPDIKVPGSNAASEGCELGLPRGSLTETVVFSVPWHSSDITFAPIALYSSSACS